MDSMVEGRFRQPVPGHTRNEPMQVLALGIQRSGTESLARALDILGYKTYHGWNVFLRPTDAMLWHFLGQAKYGAPIRGDRMHRLSGKNDASDFDSILAPFTAVTDFPACAFARELHHAYPSAKIILNTRPLEAWHASWLKTIYQIRMKNDRLPSRILSRFGQRKFWWMQVGKLNEAFWRRCSLRELKHASRWIYGEHSDMVRGLVATMSKDEREEQFLEWTIADGWEPLCRFLGKEVPSVPFPIGNATEEAMARLSPILKSAEVEALRNFLAVAIAILVAIGSFVWLVVV